MVTSSLLQPPKCPRVIYLRGMRIQPLICKLHIDMRLSTRDIFEGVCERLHWIGHLISLTCSVVDTENVRIRFMLDDLDGIDFTKRFMQRRTFAKCITIGGRMELIVNYPGEQEHLTVAVFTPETRRWEFDDQEIERWQALAVLRSLRRKAAGSPRSSDGK